MTRRQAREEAFILIFEKVFNNDSVEEILELAAETRDLKPNDYIKTVFAGIYENLEEIDEIISKNEHIAFDALVCSNDELAIGAIKALQNNGYNVPYDVKVTRCEAGRCCICFRFNVFSNM